MSRRLVVLAGALVCASLLGACGKADITQPTRTIPGSALPSTTTTAPGPQVCTPTTATPPAEGKPTVTVPEGAAPTTLVTNDLKVGDGETAQAGDKVAVEYVGVAKSTGKEFDSSWKNNNGVPPFEFTLGQGQVIKGWDEGVAGMKVGGRRQLVIPPDLGYGAKGAGTDIGPNETLVFVVDLLQVCRTQAATPGSTPTGSAVPDTAVTAASTTTTAATASSTTSAAATSGSTPK